MAQRTPIYNYYYLENNDVIYPGFDLENMQTSENAFTGIYYYFGQGIISGWKIHWMGCKSDPYVMQQRQALTDAYRTDQFSFLALQYESIGKPGEKTTQQDVEDAWAKCVVITPGKGIIDVYHVSTDNPYFFKLNVTEDQIFYVWAEKNACTVTEYLCQITIPEYPDTDYDLSNQAVYIGEIYVKNNIINQILYDPDRRREISITSGQFQKFLKQALINHVHSGENYMPPKINLSTQITISVPYDSENPTSNAFKIIFPIGFNAANYGPPKVFLNGQQLNSENFTIINDTLYLQNSITATSTLQVVYEIAPGTTVKITSDLNVLNDTTALNFVSKYYLIDGSSNSPEPPIVYSVFTNWPDYSQINLYINNILIDPSAYIFNQDAFGNPDGSLYFLGPILPSISDYVADGVKIVFVAPQVQVTGVLSSEKIESIDASSFIRGKVPKFRLNSLDHLGLFRFNEPALFIPSNKLLDSGDHIRFYPEINSPLQLSDAIIYAKIIPNFKLNANENNTPFRTVLSSANGLFFTQNDSLDFANIIQAEWNTDRGVPDYFGQNYFGNNLRYSQVAGIQPKTATLDPKFIWVLCKSHNDFKNVLYLSQDNGLFFRKVSLPFNQNGAIVTINDFIATVDVYLFTRPSSGSLGTISSRYFNDANYLYYMACDDGLYSASVSRSQNPNKPLWNDPTKNTTNSATGKILKISEAMNVGHLNVTTSTPAGSQTNYQITNYRALYASAQQGFFIYTGANGTLFTTDANNYNDTGTFTFTKFLGDDLTSSDNQSYPVIWSDSTGIYMANNGWSTRVITRTGETTTDELTFYQPLTDSYTNYIKVDTATVENIDLSKTDFKTIDGVDLVSGVYNKVLVKNQNEISENGIYFFVDLGSGIGSLVKNSTDSYPLKALVDNSNPNSTQDQTEWADLNNKEIINNSDEENRKFGLRYIKVCTLPQANQKINSAVIYSGEVPEFLGNTVSYEKSFITSTSNYIVRVLVPSSGTNAQALIPISQFIAWDSETYGEITGLQWYATGGEGTLVVFSTNGVFQSSNNPSTSPWALSASVNYDPSKFDSIKNLYTYNRFKNGFDPSQQFDATVYDAFTGKEYKGEITKVTLATTTTAVTDGEYNNLPVYSSYASSFYKPINLTVDIQIISGNVTASINNPGAGYAYNLPTNNSSQPYCIINGQPIYFDLIETEGLFLADGDKQLFTYSLEKEINPNNLIYATSYDKFYIKPWSDSLASAAELVISQNGSIIDPSLLPYTYNSSTGVIQFNRSVGIVFKDLITVTLISLNKFISNAGIIPHIEINKARLVSSVEFATLSAVFPDETNLTSNILNITFNNNVSPAFNFYSLPQNQNFSIQISTNTFKENIICFADSSTFTLRIILRPNPNVNSFPAGSSLFLIEELNSFGIEDIISLAQSRLPYHFNSISHSNIYNLYNSLLFKNPNIFKFTDNDSETLTGVERGLKNTVSFNSIDQFDPRATFIGYSFGVDPSINDIAASPSIINLILNYDPANGFAEFATDKGIWIYFFATKVWVRKDTLNDSQIIYFARNKAGTNKGFFDLVDGKYVLNNLFEEPILSYSSGTWNNNNLIYYAYGKSNGLSFVLQTVTTQPNTIQSDFADDFLQANDIFYGTFRRLDQNNNATYHPAIYVATNNSLWAYTTSFVSQGPRFPHTILVGREMLGFNLRNINKLDPNLAGVPVQVYKVFSIPSGGTQSWMVLATSNGIYVSTMWRSCDVGNANGLPISFINQNSANQSIGRQCYCVVKGKEDSLSTYYAGTDIGVYKSTSPNDRCQGWSPCDKFNGKKLSVSDIYTLTFNSINFVVAATNEGIWISDNGGESWYLSKDYPDSSVAILSEAVYGFSADKKPEQSFQSEITGSVNKAFLYLNPKNITSPVDVYARISDGISSYISNTAISFDSSSFPSMYAFEFSGATISTNTTYYLGLTTGVSYNFANESGLIWSLSNFDNPYPNGSAQTSGGQISGKDFFFKINLNTPPIPLEIIEPVGYYSDNYPIGFASGTYIGAAISNNGFLYSNVGLICNVLVDLSKSLEINDPGIIYSSGIYTGYIKNAALNAVLGTSSLKTRLTNGFGTSKILTALYGFNNSIIDFADNILNSEDSSFGCLTGNSSSTFTINGYTNDSATLLSALSFVNNTGRLSRLYDALVYNSRLQYPQVVIDYFASATNRQQLETQFLNTKVAASQYKILAINYLELQLTLRSGTDYNIIYNNDSSNFLWSEGSYKFGLVLFTNGTSSTLGLTFLNNSARTGIFDGSTFGLTPSKLYLSKDWPFDTAINGLSLNLNDCVSSKDGLEILIKNYAYSYKPFIIVTTDGNDNSSITPKEVNDALKISWDGNGTQVLIVEPSNAGKENDLRDMILSTQSKVFKYSSYPESDLKNSLVTEDDLNLFSSSWARKYDFDEPIFISYVYCEYAEPGNSSAKVKFKWTRDRINFSEFLILPNGSRFNLNQKVLSLQYEIEFIEDYNGSQRFSPYVSKLYHVKIIPSTQIYLTNAKKANGQIFETLALASFSNNSFIEANAIVGRTESSDITYFETVQLNRHSALPNRQNSFRVRPASTISNLTLFPYTRDSQGNYNYIGFYIVDVNFNIITWDSVSLPPDKIRIFFDNIEVESTPGSWQVADSFSGTIQFTLPLVDDIGEPNFNLYTAQIDYQERKDFIIGEPTVTFDNKIYYLKNGRIPTDAVVIVLINSQIYRGSFEIDYYTGAIIFDSQRDSADFVTVFIKFSDNYRSGLQILTYNPGAIYLRNYNLTFTSLPDLSTYSEAYAIGLPFLINSPNISPTNPAINDLLTIDYQYFDPNNIPENGTEIQWWRRRTGIEYVVFDNSSLLNVASGFINGDFGPIQIQSDKSTDPFILSVFLSGSGATATISSIEILDRGSNFIGTSTSVIDTYTTAFGTVISSFNNLIFANVQSPSFKENYVTNDLFVRINPNSPIGLATTTFGFAGSAILSSLPNYDNRTQQKTTDQGTRILFDNRDEIFASVSPKNGTLIGSKSVSLTTKILNKYIPSVSNLMIEGSLGVSTADTLGLNTTLTISSTNNHFAIYTFNTGLTTFTKTSENLNQDSIAWYKVGNVLTPISYIGILSNNLILAGDLVQFSIYPAYQHTSGLIGYGVTVFSDTYLVV